VGQNTLKPKNGNAFLKEPPSWGKYIANTRTNQGSEVRDGAVVGLSNS
jgi:hypothetical protein